MPPKVKFQKEEIINAAFDIVREKGAEALTAREVAAKLGVSTRPIFTYYSSVGQLKSDVCLKAKERYREYLERGLREKVPFLGVGMQFIRFAKDEPELYKLLFLTRPGETKGGATEAFRYSVEPVRESIMRIYNMDAHTAESYYRDLWLVAFGFATLIVTDDSPYTDEEMSAVFTEISLSVCKAFKEIPGLSRGEFDRDAVFGELVAGR